MATKKTPAKKAATTKKAAPTKKAPAKKAGGKKKPSAEKKAMEHKSFRVVAHSLEGEVLHDKIQETAYLLAEQDGFQGDPSAYWQAAQEQLGAA